MHLGFTLMCSCLVLQFESFTLSQSRPYICGLCGDTFAKSEELKTHHATHSRTTLLRPSLRDSFIQSQKDTNSSNGSQKDANNDSNDASACNSEDMENHSKGDNSDSGASPKGSNSFQASVSKGEHSSEVDMTEQSIPYKMEFEVKENSECASDVVIDEIKVQRKQIQRQFSVDESDKSISSDQETKEQTDFLKDDSVSQSILSEKRENR